MPASIDMYSTEWFETFAATVPAAIVEEEIKGLADILPLEQYRRVLDVGCGIGRIPGPLSSLGYAMTGPALDARQPMLSRDQLRHGSGRRHPVRRVPTRGDPRARRASRARARC